MIIWGVTIFFDDGPALLRQALTSLRKVSDRIIAVDGAYLEFPHTNFLSGPETRSVAKELADKVISPKGLWKDEAEKRNAYLIAGSEKDYYLMLDGDEEILGDKPVGMKHPTYRVKLETLKDKIWLPCMYNRLFRHHKGMSYKNHHNNLLTPEGLSLTLSQDNIPVWDGLTIKHYPEERPADRKEAKGIFCRGRAENKTPPLPNQKTPASDLAKTPVQLKYISGHPYFGYEGTNPREMRSIAARQNDLIYVSREKAEQLLRDFPKDWVKIKEL